MAWQDRLNGVQSSLPIGPPSGSYAGVHPEARGAWNAIMSQAQAAGGLTADMQLVKSVLERTMEAQSPVVGVPDLGFKGARQQLFQRYRLIDLYAIAHNNDALKTATGALKQEVFRRGMRWEPSFAYKDRRTGREYTEEEFSELRQREAARPAVAQVNIGSVGRAIPATSGDGISPFQKPDERQKTAFERFMKCVNIYGQSLLQVLHAMEDDLNIADDAFMMVSSQYTSGWRGTSEMVHRSVKQLFRLDPVFVEFDTDEYNRPGFAHHICLMHRANLLTIPRDEEWHFHWRGVCPIDGHTTYPVLYRYTPNRGTFGVTTGVASPDPSALYLVKGEVIHASKFSPSELYGYSPILSLYEKALSLIGMDRYLYDYFFERQIPQGVVTTVTDNPDDLEARKNQVISETLNNPHYIPWLAVSSKTGQGRTEFVRFAYSLDELQFLPVQEHMEKAVARLFGVPDLFMGNSEGSGGLNNETQQLTRMSRGARLSQSVFNDSIIPALLEACGITDWIMELESSEETTEEFEIKLKTSKASWAQTMVGMGFGVEYDQDADEYKVTGSVKSQDEQQAAFSGGGFGGGGM